MGRATAAMTTLRLPLLCAFVCAVGFALTGAAVADTPAVSFPFPGVTDEAGLRARMMCGWLAGLPGYRRYNGSHIHAGVDFRATLGEPILAILDGVVDPRSDTPHSGYGPGWTQGGVMIVRSPLPGPEAPAGASASSFLVVYGHTQNHRVKGGDVVRAGQVLAEVGPWLASEGGPHLHVTVRLGDLPRYGWGTPTLAGNPVRDGAETAGCEQDVLNLGYREPLAALWGIMPSVTISLP
jgi:murein DD-endopeptidase MepM/ murein hydrolase activator NlpD